MAIRIEVMILLVLADSSRLVGYNWSGKRTMCGHAPRLWRVYADELCENFTRARASVQRVDREGGGMCVNTPQPRPKNGMDKFALEGQPPRRLVAVGKEIAPQNDRPCAPLGCEMHHLRIV